MRTRMGFDVIIAGCAAAFLGACGARTGLDEYTGHAADATGDSLSSADAKASEADDEADVDAIDARLDATTDAGADATLDARLDATTDAGVDATLDAGLDATTDAGVDVGATDVNTTDGADGGGVVTGVEIAAGGWYSCARKADGTVLCWGYNGNGQLGDGTTATPRLTPTPVVTALGGAALTGVAQIAPGFYHTCARMTDGTAMCWGLDDYGEIGNGLKSTPRLSPTLVLAAPGGASLTRVTEIALGAYHTCARMTDGTAMCWGYDDDGQIGDGTAASPRLSPAPVLAAPGGASLTGVTEMALGAYHTCARMTDGTAMCWGRNAEAEIGDGTTISPRASPTPVLVAPGGAVLTGVAEIAAGTRHTCARKLDGTVLCWGANDAGQLGDGTTTAYRPSPMPVLVAAGGAVLTGVAQVAAGGLFTCARMIDSTVMCWGNNDYGQVGNGASAPRLSPTPVPVAPDGAVLTGVAEIAPGTYHVCARKTDGAVMCWGYNQWGQVGDGTTTTPRVSPTPVTLP